MATGSESRVMAATITSPYVDPEHWDGENWRNVHPLRLSDGQFAHWLRLNQQDDVRRSIGGSASAGIMCRSRYRTPASVYDHILRLAPEKPFGGEPWQQRGIELEPLVARLYSKKYLRTLVPGRYVEHPEHHFLTGHPDYFIDDLVERGVLEIKTVFYEDFQRIKSEGVLPEYAIQLQHYLYVTDASWGAFAIFNADSWDLYAFDVARDDALIEQIESLNIRFWNHHILKRVRPPEIIQTPPPIVVPQTGGDAVNIATEEWINATRAMVRAGEDKNLAEAAYKLAAAKVMELCERDRLDRIMCDGVKIARMTKAGNERLDESALFRDHPYIDLDAYRSRGDDSVPFIRFWQPKNARRGPS